MRIDFRAPARLDDALDVSVALRQCRHASLVIAQDIRCDGRLLLDAEVKVAALDADGFRPRGIPETLYEDRKSVVLGKGVSVRVDLGGRRIIKTKKIHKK